MRKLATITNVGEQPSKISTIKGGTAMGPIGRRTVSRLPRNLVTMEMDGRTETKTVIGS